MSSISNIKIELLSTNSGDKYINLTGEMDTGNGMISIQKCFFDAKGSIIFDDNNEVFQLCSGIIDGCWLCMNDVSTPGGSYDEKKQAIIDIYAELRKSQVALGVSEARQYSTDIISHKINSLNNTMQVVKNSAGFLHGIYITNTAALATGYVRLCNSATVQALPAAASHVFIPIIIPPAQQVYIPFPKPLYFSNGIAIFAVSSWGELITSALGTALNVDLIYS